jgi:hypothetical protein
MISDKMIIDKNDFYKYTNDNVAFDETFAFCFSLPAAAVARFSSKAATTLWVEVGQFQDRIGLPWISNHRGRDRPVRGHLRRHRGGEREGGPHNNFYPRTPTCTRITSDV